MFESNVLYSTIQPRLLEYRLTEHSIIQNRSINNGYQQVLPTEVTRFDIKLKE